MSKLFRPSGYHRPLTIKEALTLLVEKPNARIIAGGTEILVARPPETENLVDISRLDLKYITSDNGQVRIGALTVLHDLETSDILRREPYRIVSDAAHLMGTPLSKNIATIGGNVGYGVPSADLPVALAALNSEGLIMGLKRERLMPIESLYVDVRQTVLEPGELLGEIRIPALPSDMRGSFKKIGRMGYDLALVNTAVCIALDTKNNFRDVRIVLGAVAPTIIRAKKAEAILIGRKVTENIIEEAASTASTETRPISDIRCSAEYRREMSLVLVRRALQDAIGKVQLKE